MCDGIVHVTEDCKIKSFFETMSIAGNIQIGGNATGTNPLSVLSFARARQLVTEWKARLGVKTIESNAKMIELSGGNQQNVVIAKAAVQKPKVIIFYEPTRGVDIVEVHKFIEELADDGIAVVVISSYLPEILVLSGRILVSRQGRVVDEMTIGTASEAKIMFAEVH